MQDENDIKDKMKLLRKEKSENYGTFAKPNTNSPLDLIPDDVWGKIYLYLTVPSTGNFKKVCTKFNVLAKKFDQILQTNPRMLLQYLSWEEILDHFKELDQLLLAKAYSIKVMNSELTQSLQLIERKIKTINKKMGDAQIPPTHALKQELDVLQKKYSINVDAHTTQSLRSSWRRTKLVMTVIASIAILGAFLLGYGIKTNDTAVKMFGVMYLLFALLLLCLHRCFHVCATTISPEARSEIQQALANDAMKINTLAKLLKPDTLSTTKTLLLNRNMFFNALKATENFAEKFSKKLPDDLKEVMKNVLQVIDLLGFPDAAAIKEMFDFHLADEIKEETAILIKNNKSDDEDDYSDSATAVYLPY